MQNPTKSLSNEFAGVGSKKVRTLKPALDAIPKECLDRPTHKGALIVTRAVTIWVLSLIVLFSTDNPIVVFLGWLFASAALAGMFVVGHDAAHGSLFNSKKANKIIGRLLFLPELHSYEGWLLGHNRLHHGHTVREQMDFVWMPTTVEQFKKMNAFRKFQHKVEWSAIGSGLYYTRNVWFDKMIWFNPPERYRERIKKDVRFVLAFGLVSIVALCAYGLMHYGSIAGAIWIVVKIIAVPWFGFMTIIGWTVYVHHISPDIKWWPRNEWDSFKGQIEGTTVLHLSKPINYLFFYNIFVHVPHHVDMRIPCYNLDKAADALIKEFPEIKEKKLKFRDYIRATKACKLYDFENHTWHDYKGNVTALP
ncbi:MAG: fatty acid desaturase [Acidimicrobiia bacterium]